MRWILFCLPLALATDLAAQATPACGDAALSAAPDVWDAATAVSGDLTLDGKPDVAFWKRDADAVMLYVAACDGAKVAKTWRFRIPLAADYPADGPVVQAMSPAIDPLVDRVCGLREDDECAHMRAENRRRQAIAVAGGRDLHIGPPAATGIRLRWSREHEGFLRIGG